MSDLRLLLVLSVNKCNIAQRYKNLIEVEEIEKELEEEEDEDPVIQMRKIK